MPVSIPRLLVAGTSGDSGKTVVTVGLARAFTGQGLTVAAFKKGPDYIDASWLSAATGRKTRNLDTYLVDPQRVRRTFIEHAVSNGLNLVEGNRGLHDGLDVEGSHSSAALSKLIDCPVVVVQDVTKTTRSAAAFVLGSKIIDPAVNVAGVILNRVAGTRHENVVTRSIETLCNVPVLGALPKLPPEYRIQLRHLGLVTPREESRTSELLDRLERVVGENVDLKRILDLASAATGLESPDPAQKATRTGAKQLSGKGKVKVSYLCDSAFSFYYPENLDALEAAGAELIPVSALEACELPRCDALYVGGGFPETHATALADNVSFRRSLLRAAESGLPIYAECGGLIYLAESLSWKGKTFPMAGVFPIPIAMEEKPQGHGYALFTVDGENPFFEKGVAIRGHEFHYSRPAAPEPWTRSSDLKSVMEVKRGTGCGMSRDGLLRWNVFGTYLHIHAHGCPAWAEGVVRAAEKYRKE